MEVGKKLLRVHTEAVPSTVAMTWSYRHDTNRDGSVWTQVEMLKSEEKKLMTWPYRLGMIHAMSVPLAGWVVLKSANLLFLYFIRYIISLFSI